MSHLTSRHLTPRRGARRRAAVVVEMAIVAPLLVLVLFGIIEMGLVLRDNLVLGSACREASRLASLGKTTMVIIARANNSAVSLDTTKLVVTMKYFDSSTGAWVNLTNTSENRNCAPTGAQIRVTLTYPHTYVSPLAPMLTNGHGNVRNLNVAMVVIRE